MSTLAQEFEEWKSKQKPTRLINHRHEQVKIEELLTIFESKLALIPRKDGSYELVTYVEDDELTIIHYKLETPYETELVTINDYYKQWLSTGNINLVTNQDNTQMHTVPIPHYSVGHWNDQLALCVKLKNGHKALLTQEGIVEGCLM